VTAALALGRRAAAPARAELLRWWLFWAAALWGGGIFWLAAHPPMVDVPAHAGQVALLSDLIFGQGRWAEFLRINWGTPYLIGYGLAAPLALVMSASAALKLLLSASYLAFVIMCVALARHFQSDARLYPLFLVGFFGLAYKWGFYTFLVAAPLTLAFVLVASRYARAPSARRGGAVLALGLAMLAAHGLAFMFGWAAGAALLAAEQRHLRAKRLALLALPFAGLAAAFLAYFAASRLFQAEYHVVYEYWRPLDYGWMRLLKIPLYAIGDRDEKLLLEPLALALLASPFLIGLRLRRPHWRQAVPLATVVLMMLSIPSFAFDTAFLYERYAVFLLPALAWAFPAPRIGARAPSSLVLFLCVLVLGLYSVRAWHYGEETRAIDAEISKLAPGERALMLPFTTVSEAAHHPYVYIHYAAWYQAERGGLVDFNFAWFPPQVVRWRAERAPAVTPGFEWKPQSFDWSRHEGWRYRYFFVHGPVPAALFAGSPCPPVRIFAEGAWSIYERGSCLAAQ
jgi:hypothetical protein